MVVNMMLNSCRTDQATTAKWLQYLLATETDPADTQPGTDYLLSKNIGKVHVCCFSDGPVCDLIFDAFDKIEYDYVTFQMQCIWHGICNVLNSLP